MCDIVASWRLFVGLAPPGPSGFELPRAYVFEMGTWTDQAAAAGGCGARGAVGDCGVVWCVWCVVASPHGDGNMTSSAIYFVRVHALPWVLPGVFCLEKPKSVHKNTAKIAKKRYKVSVIFTPVDGGKSAQGPTNKKRGIRTIFSYICTTAVPGTK